ncbi:protein-disulfide reductase DsbD family protein [Croceicoccus hydrothermalis]|uniref:protein-disulfide reductase DsbD family protein n=1 Tax=Croceicoccus hydrothermalis TaxID=2867964 RepID=UPI001EFADAFF|nr:protein-disulfide reductase DsbD domain-containing protein [Croceicoccus hydrothermalis]
MPHRLPLIAAIQTALLRVVLASIAFSIVLVTGGLPGTAHANNIDARLVAGTAVSGGDAVIALIMEPAEGWHGYWSNPGDAGYGMTLDWTLPDGISVGDPQYPVPQTLLISGLMNHVYEGRYAVLVPANVSAGMTRPSPVPIAVRARWLACTDTICVPEEAELRTALTIADRAEADPRLAAWRAALPAPLAQPGRYEIAGGRLRAAIPVAAGASLAAPHLFFADDGVVDYPARQDFSRRGDWIIVETDARDGAQAKDMHRAVLRLNDGRGVSVRLDPGSVGPAGKPLADAGRADGTGAGPLALLLLAAFAGGVLLNVMPCVFPVLSLKAVALARARGDSNAGARTEALAYTAGVLAAVVALGGALLVLRMFGQEVGWAFQLQEPATIVLLFLLVTAITANLAGAYEMILPVAIRRRGGGAFGTGVLAAFVATPCTGPFMAGAMGAALLLPAWAALALFAALGLGLAAPFLAIGFVPRLRAMIPQPGRWMNAFRRTMAVPMGLTGAALFWLCWRVGGWALAITALFAGAGVLALLFMAGRQQAKGRGVASLAGVALLIAACAGGLAAWMDPAPPAGDAAALPGTQPFSMEALASARASGRPVFAYFTADWCVTCKVNEQVAIDRAPVAKAFAEHDVAVLRGDFTRGDPAIARFLSENGAAGVPLYLWYAPGETARILPQVLSADTLITIAQGQSANDTDPE